MTAVEGNQQRDANGQGNCHRTSYPLVVVVGWQQRVGGGGGSQGVKEGGTDVSSQCRESALTLSPHPQRTLSWSWLQ